MFDPKDGNVSVGLERHYPVDNKPESSSTEVQLHVALPKDADLDQAIQAMGDALHAKYPTATLYKG